MNFVDFYPRRAIMIGEKDRLALQNLLNQQKKDDDHWLIVLRAGEADGEKSLWRVSLLTARPKGVYDLGSKPIVEKECISFQEGMRIIKEWEIKLVEDRWFG